MRKSSILLLTLILALSFTLVSEASTDVKVIVNDKAVSFPDAQPFINEDDRTLVPVRFIAEDLGCSVDWDGEIRQVSITGMGKQIKLNIGQSEAYVNENKITFDTKAIIKEDRTFVPLRFVTEALGATVEWNGESRTVFVTVEDGEKDEFARIADTIENTVRYDDDTILFNAEGKTGLYDADILFNGYSEVHNNYLISIRNYKPATLEAIKKALELYYPTKYEEAYKKVLETIETGEAYGLVNYDERTFGVRKFDNSTSVYIGGEK